MMTIENARKLTKGQDITIGGSRPLSYRFTCRFEGLVQTEKGWQVEVWHPCWLEGATLQYPLRLADPFDEALR